jgi:hypothetical protein
MVLMRTQLLILLRISQTWVLLLLLLSKVSPCLWLFEGVTTVSSVHLCEFILVRAPWACGCKDEWFSLNFRIFNYYFFKYSLCSFLCFQFIFLYVQKWSFWIRFHLIFWGTVKLFLTVAAPLYIPPATPMDSSMSTSSPALIFCVLICVGFYDTHPNGCKVVSCGGFHLHFSIFSDVERHFLDTCISSLDKCLLQSMVHLNFVAITEFYTIWYWFLIRYGYANILSHSIGCLFILLIVSFDTQSIFNGWMKLDLFIYFLLFLVLLLIKLQENRGKASWHWIW